jgi:hypothetical protein
MRGSATRRAARDHFSLTLVVEGVQRHALRVQEASEVLVAPAVLAKSMRKEALTRVR